ncbi:MAG: RAMP superfamily CRISPR-associated protein, partial [Cyanobacteria bacterium P01_A01_bin.40]
MTFAQAFQKASAKKGIEIKVPKIESSSKPNHKNVPMMYRSQISGRCGLQYAKERGNEDLETWTKEWIYPRRDGQPKYQYIEPELGLDGSIYRVKLKFSFRVFSDCGQDSIKRPVIGKNGIPIIPGSSIKGLFRRLLLQNKVKSASRELIQEFFKEDKEAILRFHAAYPVGDWSSTIVEQDVVIPYRLIDVVHPQQERQVQGKGSPRAIPIVSFYHPTFIFELSCTKTLLLEQWQQIEGLLKRSLQPGLGGKTSSGYGLFIFPQNKYPISMRLKGTGVSSTLRGKKPEFRPNMFKATLKGHVTRLLAGVCCNHKEVKERIDSLFGNETSPNLVQIYWDYKSMKLRRTFIGTEKTSAYEVKGDLYLDVRERDKIKNPRERERQRKKDLRLIQIALQFTYTMGGIGKSWRRVRHKGNADFHRGFKTNYDKRGIGCHWEGSWTSNIDDEPLAIDSVAALGNFLNDIHRFCREYMNQRNYGSLPWKEAWHAEGLNVYAQVVNKSQLIDLFHDSKFKTTLAIGGKEVGDKRP